MKKLIFTLLMVTLAHVSAWADGETIFGKWHREVQVNEDLNLKMDLNVQETKSAFHLTCTYMGKSGAVGIEVPTKVEGYKFHILGDNREEKDVNGFDCVIYLTQGVWTYDLNDDRIKLITNTGDLLFMNRVR